MPVAIMYSHDLQSSIGFTPVIELRKRNPNPDNVRAHYETTGPGIYKQTDGEIDYYYFVISERKSPTACTTIPIVSFGLFLYGPKWRRSPVRKCVALHRCAEANTSRSFSGRKSVHRSPATSGTRRTVRRIPDNRPRAAGCFLSRFSRASARQYALVTTSQFPAAASSTTRDAFPSGL